jgi:hypothetical protein
MSHTKYSISSSGHTAVSLELLNSSEIHLLLTPPDYECPQTTYAVPHKPSARIYRKHVTWSLFVVVWRHCLPGSVFIEPLPRNELHNPAVLLLLACNAGRLSSRCLAMRWHVTIQKLSPYLTGNTLSHRYKDQPVNAVRETVVVYCENHTERINALYGQNTEFQCIKASNAEGTTWL